MRIKTATQAATEHGDNEDHVLTCGQVVAVFDGVTQPAGMDSGCVHGVAWYVNTLGKRLEEAVNHSPKAPLADLLSTAIAQTATEHGGSCDLNNPGTPAASICLIRAGDEQLDYLILCDTFLITDDGNEIGVLTDPRFEQAVASIRRDHLNGGNDFGSPQRESDLREATRRKQRLTNTAAGYWIAAADREAAHHAITGSLPLAGDRAIRRIALLTDGASRAVDTFNLFGWPELLDLITEQGPQELIRRVREAENSNGTARPRYKRHDDATVALCQFA